ANKIQLSYVRSFDPDTLCTGRGTAPHKQPWVGTSCTPPLAQSPVGFGPNGKGSIKITPSMGELKVTGKFNGITGLTGATPELHLKSTIRLTHDQCTGAQGPLCTRPDQLFTADSNPCSNGSCKFSKLVDVQAPPVGSTTVQIGMRDSKSD